MLTDLHEKIMSVSALTNMDIVKQIKKISSQIITGNLKFGSKDAYKKRESNT